MEKLAKIKWAPPLRPALLKRLYDSDAAGFQDLELCEKVGYILYSRCRTFVLVHRSEVDCPECGTVFSVPIQGESLCPQEGCGWQTSRTTYAQSIRNYRANTGRAMDAFLDFYQRYPNAKAYRAKMVLIDHLIHSFHIDEKTGASVKSVASKLLEGNKKAVVRFLDELSGLDPESKRRWRRTVAGTIDKHVLHTNQEQQ